MWIIAIAAKLSPDITIITFELMTNHLHILAAGNVSKLLEMFELVKRYLMQMASRAERTINWVAFKPGIRTLNNLQDARNVLVYDNRNGFLVRPDYTPFSYPWGANFCYFNPNEKKRYLESAIYTTCRERRAISHSHKSDTVRGLRSLDGAISPFSFCDIAAGESLFRDASHYFYSLGRNIEQNTEIAKEIGESISYTEDELYAAVCSKCQKEYGTVNPAQIPSDAKIAIAKMMRNNYNATSKQIQRMLRLDFSIISSLFGSTQ